MPDPDLNHPGLALDAVSSDVDLGPERTPDHFDVGHEPVVLPPLPAQLADDEDEDELIAQLIADDDELLAQLEAADDDEVT